MGKHLGFALIIVGLAGCGGSSSHSTPTPPADPKISCNFAADGECDLASGPQAALDLYNLNPAGCAASGGVVVSSCPAGRVGACTVTSTSGSTTVTLLASFYAPNFTQSAVVSLCSSVSGAFSPRLVGPGSAWGTGPEQSMSQELEP